MPEDTERHQRKRPGGAVPQYGMRSLQDIIVWQRRYDHDMRFVSALQAEAKPLLIEVRP